jgi:hypothetical protein
MTKTIQVEIWKEFDKYTYDEAQRLIRILKKAGVREQDILGVYYLKEKKFYRSVGILIEFLIWGFGEDVETDIDKIKTVLTLEDFKFNIKEVKRI